MGSVVKKLVGLEDDGKGLFSNALSTPDDPQRSYRELKRKIISKNSSNTRSNISVTIDDLMKVEPSSRGLNLSGQIQ